MSSPMIDVQGGDFGVRRLALGGSGAHRWIKMGAARSAPRYLLNRDVATFSVIASGSRHGTTEAILGGAVAGAVGVIAGLVAGRKGVVTFSCSFTDGKQFIATADPVTAGMFELGARASASTTRPEPSDTLLTSRRDRSRDC